MVVNVRFELVDVEACQADRRCLHFRQPLKHRMITDLFPCDVQLGEVRSIQLECAVVCYHCCPCSNARRRDSRLRSFRSRCWCFRWSSPGHWSDDVHLVSTLIGDRHGERGCREAASLCRCDVFRRKQTLAHVQTERIAIAKLSPTVVHGKRCSKHLTVEVLTCGAAEEADNRQYKTCHAELLKRQTIRQSAIKVSTYGAVEAAVCFSKYRHAELLVREGDNDSRLLCRGGRKAIHTGELGVLHPPGSLV